MASTSIIMPVFNAESTIGSALDAVARQTSHDWELILADDASTDATLEIIKAHELFTDVRIKLLTNIENRGVVINLNRAIDEAAGDLLTFTAGDDILSRFHCQRLIWLFADNPRVIGAFMNPIMFQDDCVAADFVSEPLLQHAHISIIDFCRLGNPTTGSTYRRASLQSIRFRKKSELCDFTLPYEVMAQGTGQCVFLQESTYFYRKSSQPSLNPNHMLDQAAKKSAQHKKIANAVSILADVKANAASNRKSQIDYVIARLRLEGRKYQASSLDSFCMILSSVRTRLKLRGLFILAMFPIEKAISKRWWA